jgi:hypothetical protein
MKRMSVIPKKNREAHEQKRRAAGELHDVRRNTEDSNFCSSRFFVQNEGERKVHLTLKCEAFARKLKGFASKLNAESRHSEGVEGVRKGAEHDQDYSPPISME